MKIIDQIFPIQCVLCSKNGAYLCKTCKKEIKAHPEICPYCHKFSSDYKICLDCRMDRKNYLEGLLIPLAYTSHIKKLILKLKYYHRKSVVQFLVDRMYLWFISNASIQQQIKGKKILVSGVPSHRWRKYFVKWYNQSELLAKAFAKKTGFIYQNIAKKKKYTKSQAGLWRLERILNLKDSFQLRSDTILDKESLLILIDDVTTTWSTLNELAKIVKQNSYKITIRWIVVWRHIW